MPRRTLVIETLHAGDVLGWSWLFPPYRIRYDARAMEEVHAIAFDGACLRQKCDADHDLGYELMRRFAQIITDPPAGDPAPAARRLRLPADRGPAMTIADFPEPFRVTSTRQETEDTWTLELESTGRNGLEFSPGQFTMLYAFGAGEVPISVSGDPRRPGTLVHTVRAVGATTAAVCAAQEGDQLGVRGPVRARMAHRRSGGAGRGRGGRRRRAWRRCDRCSTRRSPTGSATAG